MVTSGFAIIIGARPSSDRPPRGMQPRHGTRHCVDALHRNERHLDIPRPLSTTGRWSALGSGRRSRLICGPLADLQFAAHQPITGSGRPDLAQRSSWGSPLLACTISAWRPPDFRSAPSAGGCGLDNQWLALVVSVATFSLLGITSVAGVFDAHLEMTARADARRLEKANTQLNFQATHDMISQRLPNRAQFLRAVNFAIDTAEANPSNTLLAVMLIDLDRFKIVNDSLGHSYGDGILRRKHAGCEKLLTDGDIAARLGGDGFLVLVAPRTPECHPSANESRFGP